MNRSSASWDRPVALAQKRFAPSAPATSPAPKPAADTRIVSLFPAAAPKSMIRSPISASVLNTKESLPAFP